MAFFIFFKKYMIQIDWNKFFPIDFLHDEYKNEIIELLSSIKTMYENKELWFVDLDKDNNLLEIEDFVEESKWRYDNIVILWIWWSALWARALYNAIKWKYFNLANRIENSGTPNLYVLDNLDPVEINELKWVIDYTKTLFVVISKSWGTLETRAQFKYFREEIKRNSLDEKKHFVVIAWENSSFKEDMLGFGFKVFSIPENVGGRFSVLTNVWLLPLALVWIDIRALLEGLSLWKQNYLTDDLNINVSLYLALIQYHSYKKNNRNITIFYPYASNLSDFSAWYKQLIAESLWKDGIWITLVDSIWVTDQHSQLQLYQDWPEDKLIIFLELLDFEADIDIVEWIRFSDLMSLEKRWNEDSFTTNNKPNITIKLEKLNERILGELIFILEMQIVFLGKLLWVNPFNQPWVELSKNITKELLLKEKWEEILDSLN